MLEREFYGVLSGGEILVTAAFYEVFKEYIQICDRAALLMRGTKTARIADNFDILSRKRVFHDLGMELPHIK